MVSLEQARQLQLLRWATTLALVGLLWHVIEAAVALWAGRCAGLRSAARLRL